MSDTTIAINWFEIPAQDVGRAAEFYGSVLQTTIGEIPGPGGEPLNVFMGTDGPIGALMSGEGYSPGVDGPLVYFGSDDIDAVLSRVAAAGGEVLQEKTSIGDYGLIGLFKDSEGNRVALHSSP